MADQSTLEWIFSLELSIYLGSRVLPPGLPVRPSAPKYTCHMGGACAAPKSSTSRSNH